MSPANEPVSKDEDAQRPVASAWRHSLSEIVAAFVQKDYALAADITGVPRVSDEDADQIGSYIEDYGETLVELPDEAWTSSVSQWMGSHWDVLVDLFTDESGRSDLVLFVRVFEEAGGYRYVVTSVHVP